MYCQRAISAVLDAVVTSPFESLTCVQFVLRQMIAWDEEVRDGCSEKEQCTLTT